jgi:hypothetical protein
VKNQARHALLIEMAQYEVITGTIANTIVIQLNAEGYTFMSRTGDIELTHIEAIRFVIRFKRTMQRRRLRRFRHP